jgi:hypothetical protein
MKAISAENDQLKAALVKLQEAQQQAQKVQDNKVLATQYLAQERAKNIDSTARRVSEEKVVVGFSRNNQQVHVIGEKAYCSISGKPLAEVCDFNPHRRATNLANVWVAIQEEVAPNDTPTSISAILTLVCASEDPVLWLSCVLELVRVCHVSRSEGLVQVKTSAYYSCQANFPTFRPRDEHVVQMHDIGIHPFRSYREFYNVARMWAVVFRNSNNVLEHDLNFVHAIASGRVLDDADLHRLASCSVAPFVWPTKKPAFTESLLLERIKENGPVNLMALELEFDVAGMCVQDRRNFYCCLVNSQTRLERGSSREHDTVRAITQEDKEKPAPRFETFGLRRKCYGPTRYYRYLQFARWEGIEVITQADFNVWEKWDRD